MHKAEGPMNRFYGERKKLLLGDLHGTVLEIGAGAGANMPFYPKEIRLAAVEPNPYMHPYLLSEARHFGIAVDVIRGKGEALDIADGSVDAVVCTLVLCSVSDPALVLNEIKRVLKPGGRFTFIEHVIAQPGTVQRGIQNGIQPVWSCLADGCQPNRDTQRSILDSGFQRVECESFTVPRMLLASTHIAGYAIKGDLQGAAPNIN
ncbi:MAG: methyltransferase [Candidatus Hydrogenedentota bacterium]